MRNADHLCEILKPDFVFTDERGTIFQLIHEGFRQANAVFTKKGSERGGFHYHKINEELFFVMDGKIKVRLRLEQQEEEYLFEKGDMFLIRKNVRHDFLFLEDTLLVGFYDRGVELPDGGKDIYHDESVPCEPDPGA